MALEDLYDKPGHLIRRCQQIAVSVFLEECSQWDITPIQYAILSALENHAEVEQIRLAGLVAVDRSTIGSVLGRLERRGLIVREANPMDARVKRVSMTAAGRAMVGDMNEAVERAQERILAPLGRQERAALVGLLGRIAEVNNHQSRAPMRTPEPAKK
jgi:DNA-binding MarR family transcriptional regulator